MYFYRKILNKAESVFTAGMVVLHVKPGWVEWFAVSPYLPPPMNVCVCLKKKNKNKKNSGALKASPAFSPQETVPASSIRIPLLLCPCCDLLINLQTPLDRATHPLSHLSTSHYSFSLIVTVSNIYSVAITSESCDIFFYLQLANA